MKYIFKVKFISRFDCSFYLNEENTAKLAKNGKSAVKCIKVEFGAELDRCVYSGVRVCSNDVVDDGSIGLNADKARLLGIDENVEVCVSVAKAPLLSRVDVRLQEETERNLVHKNANLLENAILDYVQIVNLHEIIPIRVPGEVVINLKIEDLYIESQYGELQKQTELVILPSSDTEGIGSTILWKAENRRSSINNESTMTNQGTTKMWKIFKLLTQVWDIIYRKKFISALPKSNTTSTKIKLEESQSQICDEVDSLIFRIIPWCFAPKNIQMLIQRDTVVATRLPNSVKTPLFCQIYKMENYKDPSQKIEFPFSPVSISSLLISSGDDGDKSENILYVSDHCMQYLDVKCGAGVVVEPVARDQNGGLDCTSGFSCVTAMKEYGFTESVKKIYDDVARTIVDNVKYHQKINTLIKGSAGSGKTYLLKALAEEINRMHLSCHKIDCKSLRRMKASSVEKTFSQNLMECCRMKPSVMIIEDLDALAMDDDETNTYDVMYSARVADMFVDLITSSQSVSEITFIASCTSLAKLKYMSTDRGPIVFGNIHEINELDSKERYYLLKRLLWEKGLSIAHDKSLIEDVGNKTKGYNVQDLIDLLEIAELKHLLRSEPSSDSELTREDFESALAEKVPSSLYGVKLQKKTLTKWEDIGGMENTKNLLKEMFDWPLRYPELYASCPIRLQCGVLLYGGPGTGKTLIAGAVANEFGLNFISIRGPEVFSKYVGASEQGVRDLFSRAKKAKPCLLFFDEFDSLARKRGDSNEGVNDRVVNQLLTELDGVEELTGVFILAATSRPDLLDPALLRPGRIDRTIHCKLPTQPERLSILKALSKKVTLSEDVELLEIAEKTDGYSGADLHAILQAAQMFLVKEAKKLTAVDFKPLLKQSHLLSGLAATKPSTSREDRENYAASYEAFIASRTGRSAQRFGHIQQRAIQTRQTPLTNPEERLEK